MVTATGTAPVLRKGGGGKRGLNDALKGASLLLMWHSSLLFVLFSSILTLPILLMTAQVTDSIINNHVSINTHPPHPPTPINHVMVVLGLFPCVIFPLLISK